MMVKLEDIARATGLNVSTVSRALKDKLDISLSTRQKVKSIAKKMEYKPRHVKNNIIGVLLPEVTSQYYSEIAHSLKKKLKESSYMMIFMLTGFTGEGIDKAFAALCKQGVAGVIMNETDHTINYALLEKSGLPIVMLSEGDVVTPAPVDSIRISTETEMSLALEHLIGLGHKDIGYIGEYLSDIRFNTLCHIMKNQNIPIRTEFIKRGKERFEMGGYLRAKELINEKILPTAVIASYDQLAIGAIRAFNEAGIRIPQDISIVGVDNIVMNDFLPTKLTSITNPASQMGIVAVKLLIDNISDPSEHVVQTVALQSKLVERNSTSRPSR